MDKRHDDIPQPSGAVVRVGYVPPPDAKDVTPGVTRLAARTIATCPFGFTARECVFGNDPHIHNAANDITRVDSWDTVRRALGV